MKSQPEFTTMEARDSIDKLRRDCRDSVEVNLPEDTVQPISEPRSSTPCNRSSAILPRASIGYCHVGIEGKMATSPLIQ